MQNLILTHKKLQTKKIQKMLYFYDKKGTKIGPIHIESLKKLAETKKIYPDTIITNEKGKKWTAREMPELKFNELEFFTINTLRKLAKTKKRKYSQTDYNNNNNDIANEKTETNSYYPKQADKQPNDITCDIFETNNIYPKQKYKCIRRTILICSFISNIFLYGGFITTLTAFLILIHFTNYSYLILITGIIMSIILWHITGLYADLLTWKINVANDLQNIKSRSIHNE